MIVAALMITFLLIHSGLILREKATQVRQEKENMSTENIALSDEIDEKRKFRQSQPESIANALTLLVNEIKMVEIYGGTRMTMVFTSKRDNADIQDHFVDTEFRHVKGFPLTICVDRFSDETDMVAVLNDIYLLENRTDLKVSEISMQSNGLIVKGELYGI